MSTGHTFQTFDQELMELRAAIERMGRLAGEQCANALRALRSNDGELAASVLASDTQIDQLEGTVESTVVRLLALRQPMAGDLREIVAALRIASNIERMGDFARSIAKRAITINDLPAIPPTQSLLRMGESVQGMIEDVMTAFVTRDAALATAVRNRDSEVDRAYTALFRELLTYMMESPQQITGCTHMLFMAKGIERIGDHATNVAENICYIVQGRLPSDERPKDDLSSSVQ